MLTRAELDSIVAEILRLFTAAQQVIDAEQAEITAAGIAGNPVRAARLAEMQARVAAEMAGLVASAGEWVGTALPTTYADGAVGTGLIRGGMQWSQIHLAAVADLAQDTYSQVLEATTHVTDDTKLWIRHASRSLTGQALIEGRTRTQVARELARTAPRAFGPNGEPLRITAVTYANGTRRTIDDYADMLLRTQVARAHNAGTINTCVAAGVRFLECADAADCGLRFHGDPEKPAGKIYTADVAADHPISHPRCVRGWLPRPELSTDDEAGQASSLVDPASRADQDAADQARRLPATPPQGRPRRQPRTARQPRTPITANASSPTAPVSAALSDTSRVTVASQRHAITSTLNEIDSLHTDGTLPPIPWTSTSATSYRGAYSWDTQTQAPVRIEMASAADELTAAHEIGHFLDHHGIGTPGRFASMTSPEMQAVFDAVYASQATQAIQALTGLTPDMASHQRYLLDKREIWARAYSQWVATRSGNTAMLAEVDRVLANDPATVAPHLVDLATLQRDQWDHTDFEPIAIAIDELMRALGWMTGTTP